MRRKLTVDFKALFANFFSPINFRAGNRQDDIRMHSVGSNKDLDPVGRFRDIEGISLGNPEFFKDFLGEDNAGGVADGGDLHLGHALIVTSVITGARMGV